MPSSKPSPRLLNIPVQADHPDVLYGLDVLLQLGLVSEDWVKTIANTHFTCPIPEVVAIAPSPTTIPAPIPTPIPEPLANSTSHPSKPSESPQPLKPAKASNLPTSPLPSPSSPPLLTRLTQTVIDHFSITWILFLGVFLVVLSSVVLAASNWQSVSPPGQYAILFGYTLAFWGAASWTQRQPNIQTTAWMLRVTTLLIIPINFWMIDELGLWQSPMGWGLGILAALVLSGLILVLVRTQAQVSFIAAINTIALCGLHWGWQTEPVPLIATYVGTIGTALLVNRYRQFSPFLPTANTQVSPHPMPLGLIAIAFSTFLLVIRAVTLGQVPWSQLGLAIGLCGWVLTWISRPMPNPAHLNQDPQDPQKMSRGPDPQILQEAEGLNLASFGDTSFSDTSFGDTSFSDTSFSGNDLWFKGGAKLLLLGWLVSVGTTPPWQALIVSGLGLWLLGDRLLRSWKSIDLIALALVGLQTLWLGQRIVPSIWRDYLLELCKQLSGHQGMPTALLGLTLVPYVWVMLVASRYLRHRQQGRLAQQSDWMALGLGLCLTCVSLLNPVTRSLNLLLSTFTVLLVGRHRQIESPAFTYFSHGLIVATLLSWIQTLRPSLPPITWGILLVGMTVVEWGIQIYSQSYSQSYSSRPHLHKSAWFMGLGLGAIAYSFLISVADHPGCFIWFMVPATLTYVGHRSAIGATPMPKLAGWLSTVAVVIGQRFIFNLPGYEGWGWGITAVIILFTVPLTRSIWTAALGVGSGILWVWVTSYQLGWVTDHQLYLWAATPGLLWAIWTRLNRRNSQQTRPGITLCARAANGWAIAISALLLLVAILDSCLLYDVSVAAFLGFEDVAIVTSLILVAIGYRIWQQPSNLGLWGAATGMSILTVQAIAVLNGPIASVGLAFLAWAVVLLMLGAKFFGTKLLDPARSDSPPLDSQPLDSPPLDSPPLDSQPLDSQPLASPQPSSLPPNHPALLKTAWGTLWATPNASSLHTIPLTYATLGLLFTLQPISNLSLTNIPTPLTALLWPTVTIPVLWLMHGLYRRQEAHLFFSFAMDVGAIALTTLNFLTLIPLIVSWFIVPDLASGLLLPFLSVMSITLVAISYRCWLSHRLYHWNNPSPEAAEPKMPELALVGLAWGLGLLTAGVIAWAGGTITTLAIALIALGFLAQLLGDRLITPSPHHPPTHSITLHLIPLTYGILGWLLSQTPFTATTGLYTLALSLIAVGVGRRKPMFKPLTILAIGGITVAAYQLLIYQMQQASGGQVGDGLMILSSLATGLTLVYGGGAWGQGQRWGQLWFQTYLRLAVPEVGAIAHCHWGLANGLWVFALGQPRSHLGNGIGAAILCSLAAYALAWGHQRLANQANRLTANVLTNNPQTSVQSVFSTQTVYTTIGVWQLWGAIAFILYHLIPNPDWTVSWAGAIAALVAIILYCLPWDRWGWPLAPWQQSALIVPGVMMLVTAIATTIPCVLIGAAFYIWLATVTRQIRISYLGLGLISWAMLWFLSLQEWTRLLWISLDVGGSMLYIIQVDPALRSSDTKATRHILRTLATSLICFSSIYQSTRTPWIVIFTIGFSLLLISSGILLRTRAYLFVGTGTLIFESIRYTRQFIDQHPFQIWVVGIVVGTACIWIAATFEARRNQMRSLIEHWQTELAAWE